MLAVAVVLGTPTMVSSQAGGAYNDVVGLALVLACLAMLVEGSRSGFALGIAALAGGMAIGVKFTMLGPVGLLTIAVIVLAEPGRRLVTTARWITFLALPSAVWYLRNLVEAGNPLPGLSVSLGPLSFPELPTSTPTESVATYLDSWNIVSDVYIPGLDDFLGRGWWLLLGLSILGGAWVALRGPDRWSRVAGIVAVGAFVAYLVQPQYLGSPGFPLFFGVNVRYAAVAFVVGLLAVLGTGLVDTRRGRVAVLGAFSAILVGAQLEADPLWTTSAGDVAVAVGVVVAAAAGWAIVPVWRSRPRHERFAVGAGLLVLIVVGAWFLQRDYLAARYTAGGISNPPVVDEIRDVRDKRIAIQGLFLQYALYGPDLSNSVDYVLHRGEHGRSRDFARCEPFKRAINEGDYDFLVVARPSYPSFAPPGEQAPSLLWAASSRGAGLREIARDGDEAVTYRVTGRLDPASCP
jgi:hypothetical protein